MQNEAQAHMIFRQAMAYAAGAMAINKVLTPHLTYRDHEPLPYIMNMSFAIELLFKALLAYEDRPTKVHQFDKLLNNLSAHKRKEIQNLYKAERKYRTMTSKQFQEEVKAISNTFTRWRYLFEPDKVNSELKMGHLVGLANACVTANVNNCPSWQRYKRIIKRAKGA